MAKKNENSLTYLQMPLPQNRKQYRMAKRSWTGLNYRQTIDTGALSAEHNISTAEAPYLVPSPAREEVVVKFSASSPRPYPFVYGQSRPIALFGFDDFLIVIGKTRQEEQDDGTLKDSLWIAHLHRDEDANIYTVRLSSIGIDEATSSMTDEEYAEYEEPQRSVVQFNHYVQSDDIINGKYTKRLILLPEKKSMYFDYDELINDEENDTDSHFKMYDLEVKIKEYFNNVPEKDKDGKVITPKRFPPPESADKDCYYRNTYSCEETNYGKDVLHYTQYETEDGGTEQGWKVCVPPSFPNLKYATVHLSRLFGVSDDAVFASGFNDYTNWNMDNSSTYNESNAWCSKTQSNTQADGNFTGIISFQGHVVCFKRDFMHEVYNTKNPFRVQDIFAEGAIDQRTIQDVDGRLIFVSEDGVKLYTGSNPRDIGYNLNIPKFTRAVSGTDGRCYYLYCEDADEVGRLFVYDTMTEQWSEQGIDNRILSFAHNTHGMYMLCDDGYIYKMDTEGYNHKWWFETDLITNETVNIKHIKKMQMFADIGEGAWLDVYFLYDNESFDSLTLAEKEKRLVYKSSGSGQKAIRVKPRKTANYGVKLHVEGEGYVRLYELELFMENGGDLYV